jgi:hypothetical protein
LLPILAHRKKETERPAQEKPARRKLAEAIRSMETAPGEPCKTDVDEALSLWEGLVDGNWSLVDPRRRRTEGLQSPRRRAASCASDRARS